MYTRVTLFFDGNIVFDLVVKFYYYCRARVDVRYSYFDLIHGLGRVTSPEATYGTAVPALHEGLTPFILATCHDKPECLQMLLDANADITVKGNTRMPPITWAAHEGFVDRPHKRIEAKVNIDATDGHDIALIFAIHLGDITCAHVLIDAKANTAAKTKYGETSMTILRVHG